MSSRARSATMRRPAHPADRRIVPEPFLAECHVCYFTGASMSPAYEQGDLLIVHPSRPARPGDDCIFSRNQDDGTQQLMVKRLLRITARKWRVRQYSPAKDFDLDRSQWQQVQLIVGKKSR